MAKGSVGPCSHQALLKVLEHLFFLDNELSHCFVGTFAEVVPTLQFAKAVRNWKLLEWTRSQHIQKTGHSVVICVVIGVEVLDDAASSARQ